jgi:hypothetical protein
MAQCVVVGFELIYIDHQGRYLVVASLTYEQLS